MMVMTAMVTTMNDDDAVWVRGKQIIRVWVWVWVQKKKVHRHNVCDETFRIIWGKLSKNFSLGMRGMSTLLLVMRVHDVYVCVANAQNVWVHCMRALQHRRTNRVAAKNVRSLADWETTIAQPDSVTYGWACIGPKILYSKWKTCRHYAYTPSIH